MFIASVKTVVCHYKNTCFFNTTSIAVYGDAVSESSGVSQSVLCCTANVEINFMRYHPSVNVIYVSYNINNESQLCLIQI
jgi:hypothetical protein